MLQWAAWLCSWPDGFASGAHRYVQGFHPDMMEVVYSWVNGARFVDICSMTTAFEGTVIRVIRRLEELVRQLADSAKVCVRWCLHEQCVAGGWLMRAVDFHR